MHETRDAKCEIHTHPNALGRTDPAEKGICESAAKCPKIGKEKTHALLCPKGL
jgi:hypothetical protein